MFVPWERAPQYVYVRTSTPTATNLTRNMHGLIEAVKNTCEFIGYPLRAVAWDGRYEPSPATSPAILISAGPKPSSTA